MRSAKRILYNGIMKLRHYEIMALRPDCSSLKQGVKDADRHS